MKRTSAFFIPVSLAVREAEQPSRFPSPAYQSSRHMPTEEISRRDPFRQLWEAASFAPAHAVSAEDDSAPRCYADVFPQLLQPVHAKAGSRWPELQDVRYAVVSLLSSPAPDLIPA